MGKKSKVHRMVDGRLLQMNKSYSDLKMKQKEKISNWIYEEYKKYIDENGRKPENKGDDIIIVAVMSKIEAAEIWIPDYEIEEHYYKRKNRLQKRYENEQAVKQEQKATDLEE